MIRILVVDGQPVVCEGLAAIIAAENDMLLVGQAATADEVLKAFVEGQPDVTLMDLRLPGTSGIELTRRVQELRPGARVIMFTSYAREEEIGRALEAGVCSYIDKGVAKLELLHAIRTVHAGKPYFSREISQRLSDVTRGSDLSPREREVLVHLFYGRSNKEIAAELAISDHTVNVHVKNVLNKFGVGGRTDAVVLALRKGMLALD